MAATIGGRHIGVVAACVVAMLAAGATADASDLIQSATVEREHGALEIYQSAHLTDGSTPPALNRMVLRLPSQAKVRFTRFERCLLAKLQAFGPKGCPPGSKVGRGSVHGSYLQNHVVGRLLLYNGVRITGRRALLVYTQPDVGRAYVGVGRWKGRDLDLNVVPLSTGMEPEAVFSSYAFAFRTQFLNSPCKAPWSVTSFFVTAAAVTSKAAVSCP